MNCADVVGLKTHKNLYCYIQICFSLIITTTYFHLLMFNFVFSELTSRALINFFHFQDDTASWASWVRENNTATRTCWETG